MHPGGICDTILLLEKTRGEEGAGMLNRVYVEITNVCNLSCAFCPGTKRERRFLSPEEFCVIAEKLLSLIHI